MMIVNKPIDPDVFPEKSCNIISPKNPPTCQHCEDLDDHIAELETRIADALMVLPELPKTAVKLLSGKEVSDE